MRTSRYKIFETDDNLYQYQLLAKNGRVILTSAKHKKVEDVLYSIKKTIEYGVDMINFDMLQNSDFKLYFNIINDHDGIIATSNLYKNEQSLIHGCNSIMDNCETTTISYILGNKNG